MDNSVKKREWVKTAAIIFLAILLVLTFFSRTIMNASLPEVAAQQVSSGAINARIRGTAAVEANEVYNVTIKQTRKVASVMATVGQQVNVGDVLFVLEAEDSSEVSDAEDALQQAQDTYDSKLIAAGNDAATKNREVEKAREAYNKALALYNQYSTMPASQIEANIIKLNQQKKDLETEKTALTQQKTEAEKKRDENSTGITELEADVTALGNLKKAVDTLKSDQYIFQTDYDALFGFARWLLGVKTNEVSNEYFQLIWDQCRGKDENQIAAALAKNETVMSDLVEFARKNPNNGNEECDLSRFFDSDGKLRYKDLALAYTTLTADKEAIDALNPLDINYDITVGNVVNNDKLNNQYEKAAADLKARKDVVDGFKREIDGYEASITVLDNKIADVDDEVGRLTDAKQYASAVEEKKSALEDLIFTQGLADSSNIEMQAAKRDVEKKKEALEKLRANADEVEVKSTVVGTVGSISVTAGTTAGADTPLATINVTDRGYTVKIEVDTEQAKKVRVGDTAELVNFWGGDVTATLDKISGSQNQGKKTLEFKITGDIEPGQNVTLSIGQKSANYDALVPLSALHEDSNGKFVYVMTTKSSPLGNRYIATRVTVQELARDDKSAAVSGVSMGDFVITTSDKPFDAGSQVRLADNG